MVNRFANGLPGLEGSGRSSVHRLVLLCLLIHGCSSGERVPPNEKPTIPVSGVVLVDGAPVAGIQIRFHAVNPDPQNATLSMAETDENGQFKAWTYRINDGIPPGEYTVTFNDQSKAQPHLRSNPDLFKGRYSDPEKSTFKLTVPVGGEPIDMGEIQLTR